METQDFGKIEGRMLIFGGPYGNLTATRAIQAKADSLNIPPERILCTGDLVAYCAEPVETTAPIRDEYANALVKKEQRRWMADLPRSISFQYGGFGC